MSLAVVQRFRDLLLVLAFLVWLGSFVAWTLLLYGGAYSVGPLGLLFLPTGYLLKRGFRTW